MRFIKKFIGFRVLKTAIGVTVAIILAQVVGLKYAVSAGIITILSIQNTKKQSVELAIKRILSTLMALFISGVLFKLLGFNAVVFGIYVLIFIPVAVRFKLADGIVVSSVLVTHLLVEQTVNMFWIGNEIGLILVGAGVALILNLYMPSIETQITKDKEDIEKLMNEIWLNMAISLENHYVSINEENLFLELKNKLNDAKIRAYKNSNNYLITAASSYETYFEMREKQFEVMKYMREHFNRFFMNFEETKVVAEFTRKVAFSIYESFDVNELISELRELRVEFKKSKLPASREEFENRAMLFQFLNDIDHFLQIKKDFIELIE